MPAASRNPHACICGFLALATTALCQQWQPCLIVCLQAGGYGKVITHVVIGLKTVKGTKQLKLDPTIYDSLQKEKVLPGDVIYIEANSGGCWLA